MSDQVTNVDIEDVLSSIRRLVAEGDQKKAVRSSGYGEGDVVSDKLVLTPNFRVKEAEQTSAPAADIEDQEIEQDAPVEADPSEDEMLVLQPEQSVPKNEELLDISGRSLEETVAGFEARVSDPDKQWEPDGSEVTTPELTWTSSGFSAAPPETFPPEPEDLEPVKILLDRKEKPAATEPVIEVEAEESTQPTFKPAEPDMETFGAFVPHPRPHRWSEQVERRTLPMTDEDDTDYGDDLADAKSSGGDEMLEQYLHDGRLIDEAALRRVVQEVLREELQGPLGERITRNVRKLVRREIHNILTTQEFE